MPDSNSTLQKLISLRNDVRSNALINVNVQSTINKILSSINDENIQLQVNKIWIDDKLDNSDIEAQKRIKNNGQIWGSALRADLTLVDKKTGKPIDRNENIKIATIPKLTDRNTFIIRGNEYQFMKQSRLKPGVYTKIQTNGEISSFFNVDKTVDFERGFNNNFKINFDPETKVFIMTYGTKNIPLINALRALDVSRDEMIDKWGKDVLYANEKAYDHRVTADQEKLYEAVFGKKPPAGADIKKEIKDRLFATKLDPDVNKITLGKPYDAVNKNVILDASKKIIDIHRGSVEPDDRESLIFKSFYDVEDHMRDRLIKNSNKIIWNIKNKLKKNRSINKSISSQIFDPLVIGTITTNNLAGPPAQTNILSILGDSTKTTVMGEGGIGSANAITKETRQISNSEVAFIDPLHTPEGSNIGVTVHTTMDTVKIGNDLYSKFIDKNNKKTVILRPIDIYEKYVGFPDQFDDNLKPKTKIVKAIYKGKFVEVPAHKVDVIIPDAMGMFDTSVNQIPFLDSIQGNRGLTASKMQEQALPLVYREKPHFDIVHKSGKSISEAIGSLVALPKSKVDGKVEKVTETEIVVNGVSHPLYHNFSLNAESFLNNEPIVKVGDIVKKGQVLADNNFTREGKPALGVNLKVAYMPYKGYNYEDSAVISESAAKKLTSMHMYDFKARRSSKGVFSKSKFKAYYPEELPAKMAEKLDSDGIIKPGSRVERDDIIIAHLERKAPTADDIAVGRLDKQLRRDMADFSQRWDKDVTGIVTNVNKHGNNVVVSIKTEEPLKVADKIAGLHGNKHIISAILPDDQMPFNPETGERIDITMNPIGVSNRINTSQLLEAAAGKIAEKTGKPFKIENFKDVDNTRALLNEMKKLGIAEKEILVDPETNQPFLNPIFTGKSHILKLEHIVDHKFSARYRDGYDSNEQPVSGGHTGAKNLGRMEIAALLARGANENLKEMFNIKGQRNDEYWKAMETGQSLPPPKNAFVKDKMLAMMAGAGINVEQKGKTFALRPMTDDEILARSRGELKNPEVLYRKKDMAPMKEGLYDPVKAGGIFGDHYTHFKLPEKILNPVTAHAAAILTNRSVKDLEDIINGKVFIDKITGKESKPGDKNAISGGPAVELLLSKVDVKNELKDAEQQIQLTTNPSKMNKLHKKIRYLKALQENKMSPTDYMIQNVLVIPSKYRPIFAMGTDGTVITSDINDLYQSAARSASALKNYKQQLKDSGLDEDTINAQLAEIRGALYNDVKAISGLQEPTSYLHRIKNKKGFIYQIGSYPGKQSKEGFFQDKVLERKQDLVGRSTIILNPKLGGDQIGIPKEMAAKIFQPFIMKKMVEWGYKPLEAAKHVEDRSPIFQRALQVVADQRLVIANRAPTLHMWNMTAFKPVLVEGKSIEVPAIGISRNFGGDFDGDTFQIHTPISQKALEEAKKMLPSASMLKTGYDTVLNSPQMDMAVGAFLASKGVGGKDVKLKFKNIEEARQAFKQHKFTYGDMVTINNKKATFGIHEINESVPDDVKKWNIELNQDNIDKWINEVTKKYNGKIALGLADKIKEVGNNYVTKFGFTIGLSDTVSDKELQKKVLNKANKLKDPVKKFTDILLGAREELKNKHGESTMLGIGIKSGGSKGIENTAAITLMPGILADSNDKPIPIPVTKSYSEGLDTFSYWAAAHGARAGNIKKSVSSYMPGWLTKDLTNSLYQTRIVEEEPVDSEGVEYSIEDRKGIMNRFLARDVKDKRGKVIARRNDLVDSNLINKLNQNKIKTIFVQSPLTDPTPGDGFSAYSYGVDYENKLHNRGDNIGIISAHTITEPSVNLAMKAFHTGGAVTKERGAATVFDKLDKLLRFQERIPNKATIASSDAKVKNIVKSSIGGYDIILDNNDIRYVAPGNEPTVKKGDVVFKGQQISTGTPSVHDILKYRGMKDAQKFLVQELDNIFQKKLDKRDIETVVRGITNTTRIMHPGSSNFVTGDIAPTTTVEFFNKNNEKEQDIEDTLGDHLAADYGKYKKHTKITKDIINDLSKAGIKRILVFKDRIKHSPFLVPLGVGGKASIPEDWISRLAHANINKVLTEGTTMGYKSEASEVGSPIPKLVMGM